MQSYERRHFLNESDLLGFAQNLFLVKDQALPETICEELYMRAQEVRDGHLLRTAGLADGIKDLNLRGDLISWIETEKSDLRMVHFLTELQQELNEHFLIGIDHFETHLALYGPGKGYQTHLDQPMTSGFLPGEKSERWVTFVLYLNKEWHHGDGGELEIQLPERNLLVSPLWNRMVLFRSDKILHQVLVSQKDRWSLTGWFKKRR